MRNEAEKKELVAVGVVLIAGLLVIICYAVLKPFVLSLYFIGLLLSFILWIVLIFMEIKNLTRRAKDEKN